MVRIGESFGPHSDAKKLYYTYLLIPAVVVGCVFAIASIAIVYFVEAPGSWAAVVALFVPYLIVIGFVAYWIPKYFPTVSYMLTEDRIVFQGGHWWKRKSYVPYNRITNIDLLQGPLSRRYGLGKVSIQTAGYSGQAGSSGRFAEISIFGVKDFEEIKDAIMGMVVRYKPVGAEAGVETAHKTLDVETLEELKRIRKGIEELSGKK